MAPGEATFAPLDASTAYLPDLGGFDLAKVRQLPTDSAALRALIVARIAAAPDGFAPGTWGSNIRLFGSLTQLLLYVPAPPLVRAAAFAALADIPGVHGAGQATDAQGRTGLAVELTHTSGNVTEDSRLVIDPATHLILAYDYTGALGTDAAHPLKQRNQVILTAEWTNQKPTPPTVP